MGYLITETDELGTPVKDYVWMEGMHPVAQIDNQGAETLTYLHSDHLMTARLATDDLQTIVWRWEGEAFGNTPAEEISGVSVNLRFPGQYFDTETNLHYNWHRYYDPQLGRYITSDPIGLRAGPNTYNYVNANPLVLSDPSGELGTYCAVWPWGTAVCAGEATYHAYRAYRMYRTAAAMAAAAAALPVPQDCPSTSTQMWNEAAGEDSEDEESGDDAWDDAWPEDKYPLKNRKRRNKERSEKPKDRKEAEKRREDKHDRKHRTGRGGADASPEGDDW